VEIQVRIVVLKTCQQKVSIHESVNVEQHNSKMFKSRIVILLLGIIGLACLAETRRLYVKPNPSSKRATDLVGDIGILKRELGDINGYVVEV